MYVGLKVENKRMFKKENCSDFSGNRSIGVNFLQIFLFIVLVEDEV